MQFCNFTSAARAFAHHLTGRSEQVLGSLDDLISSHQVFQHGADPVQKLLWGKLPALDLAQAILPLGSQKRRLQLFRQHRDKGYCIVGRKKLHRFSVLFSLQKTGRYQLFQNTGTGGRCPQTFSLSILWHIIFPGSLHCGQ